MKTIGKPQRGSTAVLPGGFVMPADVLGQRTTQRRKPRKSNGYWSLARPSDAHLSLRPKAKVQRRRQVNTFWLSDPAIGRRPVKSRNGHKEVALMKGRSKLHGVPMEDGLWSPTRGNQTGDGEVTTLAACRAFGSLSRLPMQSHPLRAPTNPLAKFQLKTMASLAAPVLLGCIMVQPPTRDGSPIRQYPKTTNTCTGRNHVHQFAQVGQAGSWRGIAGASAARSGARTSLRDYGRAVSCSMGKPVSCSMGKPLRIGRTLTTAAGSDVRPGYPGRLKDLADAPTRKSGRGGPASTATVPLSAAAAPPSPWNGMVPGQKDWPVGADVTLQEGARNLTKPAQQCLASVNSASPGARPEAYPRVVEWLDMSSFEKSPVGNSSGELLSDIGGSTAPTEEAPATPKDTDAVKLPGEVGGRAMRGKGEEDKSVLQWLGMSSSGESSGESGVSSGGSDSEGDHLDTVAEGFPCKTMAAQGKGSGAFGAVSLGGEEASSPGGEGYGAGRSCSSTSAEEGDTADNTALSQEVSDGSVEGSEGDVGNLSNIPLQQEGLAKEIPPAKTLEQDVESFLNRIRMLRVSLDQGMQGLKHIKEEMEVKRSNSAAPDPAAFKVIRRSQKILCEEGDEGEGVEEELSALAPGCLGCALSFRSKKVGQDGSGRRAAEKRSGIIRATGGTDCNGVAPMGKDAAERLRGMAIKASSLAEIVASKEK